jgi:hypothetical protein
MRKISDLFVCSHPGLSTSFFFLSPEKNKTKLSTLTKIRKKEKNRESSELALINTSPETYV